jgi:hypothetical protein
MREEKTLVAAHYLKDALAGNCETLGEKCGDAAVQLFVRRLTGCIGQPEDDKYTYVHRKAIEEHEQDSYSGDSAVSVFIDALRDTMIGYSRVGKDSASSSVAGLLQSNYVTVVRVGLYICDKNYHLFSTVFENNFQEKWLIDVGFWHEAYWLVKNNYSNFSASLKHKFRDFVERLPGEWDEDDERVDDYKNYHRRDLLGAALGQGDIEVDNKYHALEKKYGPVREHIDFHSYSSAGWVGSPSPKSSEEFLKMSSRELSDFMSTFVPERNVWDGPSYRGASMSLQEAVKAKDDGFKSEFDLFSGVHPAFQHGLLSGLKDRLTIVGAAFDWTATVELVQKILSNKINQSNSVDEASQGGLLEPTAEWVLADISDLIKAGFQSEDKQIPPSLQIDCLKIVLNLLSTSSPSDTSDTQEAVSKMINNRYGKALETSLVGALAVARVERAKTAHFDVWTLVGPVYEAALDDSEHGANLEFATFAGLYSANLHFLAPDWVEANFDRMFSLKSNPAWLCAAQGFSYQNHLYPWLYKKLKDGDHLYRMITEESLKDQVRDRAMQFLGLAYLNDDLEPLSESEPDAGLLAKVMGELNENALSRLCWFFWTLRGQGPESEIGRKVIKFWMKLDCVIYASTSAHPELLSALNSLSVFIETLDDVTTKLLKNAAVFSNIKFHTHTLVTELARLSEKNPREVSEIFDEVTDKFLPDFEESDVIIIVENIAKGGNVDVARKICNKYADKQVNFLNDVFSRIRSGEL